MSSAVWQFFLTESDGVWTRNHMKTFAALRNEARDSRQLEAQRISSRFRRLLRIARNHGTQAAGVTAAAMQRVVPWRASTHCSDCGTSFAPWWASVFAAVTESMCAMQPRPNSASIGFQAANRMTALRSHCRLCGASVCRRCRVVLMTVLPACKTCVEALRQAAVLNEGFGVPTATENENEAQVAWIAFSACIADIRRSSDLRPTPKNTEKLEECRRSLESVVKNRTLLRNVRLFCAMLIGRRSRTLMPSNSLLFDAAAIPAKKAVAAERTVKTSFDFYVFCQQAQMLADAARSAREEGRVEDAATIERSRLEVCAEVEKFLRAA